MKKLKGIVLATVLSALVFSGCKQSIIEDAVVAPSETNTTATVGTAQRTITITATTDEGVIKFPESSNKAARTILPDALKGSDMTFYLGSKKRGESDYTFVKTTFTADDATGCKGKVQGTFDLASYEFKLYAVPNTAANGSSNAELTGDELKDSTIKGKATFAGYAAADLRYNDAITFYLSANSLTGNGTMSITITSTWKIPSGFEVKAGLYDYNDNLIKDSTGQSTEVNITPDSLPAVLNTSNYTGNSALIAAGTYNVKITIRDTTIIDPKTNKPKEYIYSEKAVILANRQSKGSIEVPEIIEYKPTQPADFIAGYTEATSTDNNYYNVVFAWTDTSYCERGFELEIMELADSDKFPASPKTDDDWGDETKGLRQEFGLSSTSYSPTEFPLLRLNKQSFSTYSKAVNDGLGSLNMNSNHVTIQIPMERRFTARIRAYNDVGYSDYTYLDLHDSDLTTMGATKGKELSVNLTTTVKITPKVTTSSYTIAATKFDSDVETINRYKINYHLVGGKFADAAGTLTDDEMPITTIYESQHTASGAPVTGKVAILKPNSSKAVSGGAAEKDVSKNTYLDVSGNKQTDICLQLKNGDYLWTQWLIDSTSGSPYYTTPGATDGAENGYDIPQDYTGFANLNLFAKYATSTNVAPGVEIENIAAYELKNTDISFAFKKNSTNADVGLTGGTDGAFTIAQCDSIVEFTENTVSNIIVAKITADSGNIPYNTMTLTVTRVNDNQVLYESEQKSEATDFAPSYNVDISGYTPGKYIFAITATTKKAPNITYSQVQTISIVSE